MDPFFVVGGGEPWRYAKVSGYEILSHYPDSTTVDFLRGMSRAEKLLGFFVPEPFRAKFDVPQILILCDKDIMSPMSRDIIASISGNPLDASASRNGGETFPNVEVFDRDLVATLITNDLASLDARMTLINSSHVRQLLDRRTPQLPEWLITGIMSLYTSLNTVDATTPNEYAKGTGRQQSPWDWKDGPLGAQAIVTDRSAMRDQNMAVGFIEQQVDFDYRVLPFTWISPEETKKIRTGKQFLGDRGSDGSAILSALLSGAVPKENADWKIWKARATLFVRWALDGKSMTDSSGKPFESDWTNSPRRVAFWKFVARASREPVTEGVFKEYFGLSYRDVAMQLANYLPVAITKPIDLSERRGAVGEIAPELRNATRTEITRITAEWERLVLSNVRGEYQGYTSNYTKEALTQAYKNGVRDPRLLAVMGLFDHDSGDDTNAKGFLEAAVKAGVVGPRVYFELAQIRYHERRNFDNSPLSTEDANYIIEPLEAGRSQSPPLLESYELAAKVMEAAQGADVRPHLNYLDSVQQYFPRNLDLVYRAASLSASNGYEAEASALAETGVQLSANPQDRAQFSKLKVQATQTPVETPPSKGEK
jgi:hypothetical protein